MKIFVVYGKGKANRKYMPMSKKGRVSISNAQSFTNKEDAQAWADELAGFHNHNGAQFEVREKDFRFWWAK